MLGLFNAVFKRISLIIPCFIINPRMSWGWKSAVIAYAILPTCLIVLFTFLSIAEQLTFTFYFLVIGVFFCQFLQLLPTCTFKFAQHYNTVIVYKSRKWGMTKRPLGFFGKFFKSPALCLQVEKGLGSGDVEPAVFYNVVLSVTWQLTAVQLSPPTPTLAQQTDPVIFSIWKILGVTSVSDCVGWSQMGVFL